MNQSARTAKTEMKKYYYYHTHARTHGQLRQNIWLIVVDLVFHFLPVALVFQV